MTTTHTLPFGKHKHVPLAEVPTSYLTWVCREVKLSSGLAAAVRVELARRSVAAPPPPEPKPHRCPEHPDAFVLATWISQRDGRRAIRGECCLCRRWLGALPLTPLNVALADVRSNKAALLDLLTKTEDAGITVRKVRGDLQFEPRGRMTRELWDLERQCRGLLISLLKDEEPRPQETPR